MSRTPVVAGNWKMHTGSAEAARLAAEVMSGPLPADVTVVLCPPFPWLGLVSEAVNGSAVRVGGQDCWTEAEGAFTGQVSPTMLAEIARYVILGHSERRRDAYESDELVARKTVAALAAGLRPIVCVGEDLAIRSDGRAEAYVERQVRAALSQIDQSQLAMCAIAYEPIWAIGTGVSAEPGDAQAMANLIRSTVADRFDSQGADQLAILYGGSVKPANAAAYAMQADIDGALVGGASLDAEDFRRICWAASSLPPAEEDGSVHVALAPDNGEA